MATPRAFPGRLFPVPLRGYSLRPKNSPPDPPRKPQRGGFRISPSLDSPLKTAKGGAPAPPFDTSQGLSLSGANAPGVAEQARGVILPVARKLGEFPQEGARKPPLWPEGEFQRGALRNAPLWCLFWGVWGRGLFHTEKTSPQEALRLWPQRIVPQKGGGGLPLRIALLYKKDGSEEPSSPSIATRSTKLNF